MPPAPDRALRRLVARLATLDAADVDGVLEGLEDAQRRRVRALLAEYLAPARPAAALPAPRTPAVPGLAAWLQLRLDPPSAARPGARSAAVPRMTPAARDALAAAAEAVAKEPAAEPEILAPPRGGKPARRTGSRKGRLLWA